MDTQPTQRIYTRERNWDYRQPAVYLITFTVKDRQPLLGTLVGGVDDARVEMSEIGKWVSRLISMTPQYHPEIKIIAKQIMPDHVHFILHVTQTMPVTLGRCLWGLKQGCNKAWREILAKKEANDAVIGDTTIHKETKQGESFSQQEQCSCEKMSPQCSCENTSPEPLFSPDFYPSRLKTRGQLQAMIAYLRDNPRRLAVKRASAGYFRIERGVMLAGAKVDLIGNQALLKQPLQAVHVRHVWTPPEIEQYARQCLAVAQSGAALISPFISQDERRIRDSVLQQGGRIVVIRKEGFGELYKPEPLYFDACAEGRVLLVAVGDYRQKNERVSRAECETMNALAECLAMGLSAE